MPTPIPVPQLTYRVLRFTLMDGIRQSVPERMICRNSGVFMWWCACAVQKPLCNAARSTKHECKRVRLGHSTIFWPQELPNALVRHLRSSIRSYPSRDIGALDCPFSWLPFRLCKAS